MDRVYDTYVRLSLSYKKVIHRTPTIELSIIKSDTSNTKTIEQHRYSLLIFGLLNSRTTRFVHWNCYAETVSSYFVSFKVNVAHVAVVVPVSMRTTTMTTAMKRRLLQKLHRVVSW